MLAQHGGFAARAPTADSLLLCDNVAASTMNNYYHPKFLAELWGLLGVILGEWKIGMETTMCIIGYIPGVIYIYIHIEL